MPLEPPRAGLLLGTPEPNAELDVFLEKEGYTRAARRYHPVIRCWCGGEFTPAPLPHPAFDGYQLCAACGCLVLKHVATNEGLDELYGLRYFREHQQAIGHPPFESRWHSDAKDRIPFWLRTVRRYCPDSGSILEIGCSHGRFLLEATRAGYSVLGLELDAGVADWARRQNEGMEVRSARIEEVPAMGLPAFDLVFAVDVLEHVYDPAGFASAVARVIRPSGCALFHTVVFDTPRACPPSMARPLYHPILFSRDSLALLRAETIQFKETTPGLFGCEFVVLARTAI